jgi:hypothetical protein
MTCWQCGAGQCHHRIPVGGGGTGIIHDGSSQVCYILIRFEVLARPLYV